MIEDVPEERERGGGRVDLEDFEVARSWHFWQSFVGCLRNWLVGEWVGPRALGTGALVIGGRGYTYIQVGSCMPGNAGSHMQRAGSNFMPGGL